MRCTPAGGNRLPEWRCRAAQIVWFTCAAITARRPKPLPSGAVTSAATHATCSPVSTAGTTVSASTRPSAAELRPKQNVEHRAWDHHHMKAGTACVPGPEWSKVIAGLVAPRRARGEGRAGQARARATGLFTETRQVISAGEWLRLMNSQPRMCRGGRGAAAAVPA